MNAILSKPEAEMAFLLGSVSFRKTTEQFWHFRWLDAGIERLTGFKASDLIEDARMPFNRLLVDERADDASGQAIAALAESRPYQILYPISTADGETRWLLEKGFATGLDDRGEQVVQGFLTDVSSQILAVEELKQQKTFYEGTLNRMPVELVVLDANQRYIFCNEAAIKDEQLRRWLIGKTDLDYCHYRGKDPATVEVRRNYFEQAVETKDEIEWEEVQLNREGEYDYSLKRYSPILDAATGQIRIVIGYGFNISDRRRAEIRVKESEQLLRSMSENVEEGIYRVSPEGKLLYANKAFFTLLSLYGHEGVALLSGKQITSEGLAELLCPRLDPGQRISREFSLELDGVPTTWLCTARRGLMGEDTIDGVIVDISAIKRTEQELVQKNEELEKAYMELDRFVYSASHDLRAPLTSLMGVIQIAEADPAVAGILDGEFDYLSMIKTSVNRLDVFVREIINYYRNRRTEIRDSLVDLTVLCSETVASLRHMRPGYERLDYQIAIARTEPLLVDAGRLSIVLNNLIANAIKYHNKPEGYIRVTSHTQTDGSLLLAIADNGPGIKDDHKERVFDMFYRVSLDNSGSGLGLYIVSEAVKKLGGSIWLESEFGRGTTFFVQLPQAL